MEQRTVETESRGERTRRGYVSVDIDAYILLQEIIGGFNGNSKF